MNVFLFVEIDGAGGAAFFVDFNFVDVAIGTDFAFAGLFGKRNHAGQRAGFGFDFTTKGQTETAVDTGTSAGARLGKDGHRRRKRIPAEFARGAFKNNAVGFYRQRRHGIWLGTRGIERAGAGESGDAHFPFHFGVVRLEVGVGDRPVDKCGAGDRADFAALLEIDFVEAPEIGGEMVAGAADGAAIDQSALRPGFVLGRFAESGGLQFWFVGEQIFGENLDFVVHEIFFGEVRTLLEHHHAETVGGKFLGENAAGGAGTNDDEIDCVGRFIFGRIGLHFLSASLCAEAGCQPG